MNIRQLLAIFTLAGAPASALACGSFGSADGASSSSPDASTEATADGGEAGGLGCPNDGKGPRMVLVTAGLRTFCIDATEVTRAQYMQFLDNAPSPSTQPPACASNKSFAPSLNLPDGGDEHPIVGVAWCDAYAFCAWAGKRLCGGPDGAPLPLDAGVLKDPDQSEWMAACSRNGTRTYPYGASAMAGACNTSNDAGAAPVGTHGACEGGYAGLFDMVGNVTEWENACDDVARAGGVGGRCADRGGSFKQGGACAFASLDLATEVSQDWGIRCCATPR